MIYNTVRLNTEQIKSLIQMVRIHWILMTESAIRDAGAPTTAALDAVAIGDQFLGLLLPLRAWRDQLEADGLSEIQCLLPAEFLPVLKRIAGSNYKPVAAMPADSHSLFEELEAVAPGISKALEDAGVYDPDVEASRPSLSGKISTELN